MRKRITEIKQYWDILFYFVIWVSWNLIYFILLDPVFENLSIDVMKTASANILEVLGLLIGFFGLSTFYFMGKFSEVSERLFSKILEFKRLSSEYSILRRTIEKMDNEDEEFLTKLKKLFNKFSEETLEKFNIYSKTKTLTLIYGSACFFISLLLSIFAISTEGLFFGPSIHFTMLGVMNLFWELYVNMRVINNFSENYREICSLNNEVIISINELKLKLNI